VPLRRVCLVERTHSRRKRSREEECRHGDRHEDEQEGCLTLDKPEPLEERYEWR
jgi:hypothetical protein